MEFATYADIARRGRLTQRHSSNGHRLVVGCIPYRKMDDRWEVLVISSQKGNGIMFPKGGWELEEKIKQAASREAWEEAGVQGVVESILGRWSFKSKRYGVLYDGYMFPLSVKKQLDVWPEYNVRKRQWVSVAEAKEACLHLWMKEALDVLICRLSHPGVLCPLEQIEEGTDDVIPH